MQLQVLKCGLLIGKEKRNSFKTNLKQSEEEDYLLLAQQMKTGSN